MEGLNLIEQGFELGARVVATSRDIKHWWWLWAMGRVTDGRSGEPWMLYQRIKIIKQTLNLN